MITAEQLRYLEQLDDPYAIDVLLAIPGHVARPMCRAGWIEYHEPINGRPLYGITHEGRQILRGQRS